MKRQRIVLLLLLLLSGLASCSAGHLGSNVIAFVRDDHLWTIDPNGANAFAIVAQDTPVVSYSWSPNHQLLTFRMLDPTFAKTSTARHLSSNPITGLIGDIPSTANTIGVDGGTPITIAFSSPDISISPAIWNSINTRLLYRETPSTSSVKPDNAQWWVSQNDQPGGIAIKSLPDSYSIPSLSYATETQNQLAIESSSHGLFTTTLAGTNIHYLQQEPLVGHPLPASLERVLWQPAHQHAQLLYALPLLSTGKPTQPFKVQLILRTLEGQTTTIATCACQQFAWSPDGNYILYNTGPIYTIVNINNHTTYNITGEPGAVPYWSPNSQLLILDGLHTMELIHAKGGQATMLLSDTSTTATEMPSAPLPSSQAMLQPATNNIWAADSQHFLFLTHDRLLWQKHQLHTKGLYTVAVNASGQLQGEPVLVDTGNDTQAGWTYEDTNTSFLYHV